MPSSETSREDVGTRLVGPAPSTAGLRRRVAPRFVTASKERRRLGDGKEKAETSLPNEK